MENCIFCEIAKKEKSAHIVYEDDTILAFKDIAPMASIHILIIPKKHIASIDHLEDQDKELIGEMFLVAKKIAKEKKIQQNYKLTINVGRGGGQIIDHLHLHLISKKPNH
jgi:histidine triad (HIT) family protein